MMSTMSNVIAILGVVLLVVVSVSHGFHMTHLTSRHA